MIAKAKSCVGGTALVGYVVNPQKGYELMRNNLSGETASEVYESMQIIQNQNLRCKNNTISIVLSPEIEDGKKLSNEQWQAITNKLLVELGVDAKEAQYLCFIHTEKEHKHAHVVLNRVKDDGSLLKDNYIGVRAQHIAHNIAIEMGLKSAMEMKRQREQSEKERMKEFRMKFRKEHEQVRQQLPTGIEEYIKMMKERGFEVNPTINKQGNVQGYRVKNISTGEDLKLSQIDRKIKLDDKIFEELAKQRISNPQKKIR